jgi:SAM-dependent methyltransferase
MFLLVHNKAFYTFFMSLQVYYEQSYQAQRMRDPEEILSGVLSGARGIFNFVLESKEKFLKDKDWRELKVVELGAGRGGVGLLLARLGAQVTLVDFSPTALEDAQELFRREGLKVSVKVADVGLPEVGLDESFDVMVDSHLLHCLALDPERASYFKLILDHLSPEGIFVCETMVHRKKIHIPEGFLLDEKKVLWQNLGHWTPVRRILDSLDLEEEIRASGLNISYFIYYANFGFVPHSSFMDLPADILPAGVRMVLTKKAI